MDTKQSLYIEYLQKIASLGVKTTFLPMTASTEDIKKALKKLNAKPKWENLGIRETNLIKRIFNDLRARFITEKESLTAKQKTDLLKLKSLLAKGPIVVELPTLFDKDNIFTLSLQEFDKFSNYVRSTLFIQEKTSGSDALENIVVNDIDISRLKAKRATVKTVEQSGKFFPFINNSKYDLSRYQCYTNKQLNTLQEIEHCLIHTLNLHGIKPNSVATELGDLAVNKKQLTLIAEELNVTFVLRTYRSKSNKPFKYNYGKGEKIVNLALYEGHYFIDENTPYTLKQIKNNLDEPVGKLPISSLTLLRLLKESKKLSKNPALTKFTECKDDYDSLCNYEAEYEYNEVGETDLFDEVPNFEERKAKIKQGLKSKDKELECELNSIDQKVKDEYSRELISEIIKKKKEERELNNDHHVLYADFESDINGPYHKLLLAGCSGYNNKGEEFHYKGINDDQNKAITNMLWYIRKNVQPKIIKQRKTYIIYFHNLKYDWQFFKVSRDFYVKKFCKKDNSIYSITLSFGGCDFWIKDSYKLIATALANFPRTFGLSINKKEYISYKLFTLENIHTGHVDIEKVDLKEMCIRMYKKKYTTDFKKEFIEHLKTCNPEESYYDGGIYFHTAHYLFYLKYDCMVLMQGIKKLREDIYNITSLDIHDYLTSARISIEFGKMVGALNQIGSVRGCLLRFCQKAAHGGRVCTRYNESYAVKIPTEDFDAVSLYPSAIKRLVDDGYGLPAGKIYKADEIPENHYYIARIKITNITKKQQIPFCVADKKGTKNYTNDASLFDEPIIIDKFTLEDWVEFQGIEYEFIECVYWKKYNTISGYLMYFLKKERDVYKSQGNTSMSNNIKLLMNSFYGKLYQKPCDYDTYIVSKDKYADFVTKYANLLPMNSTTKICDQYHVKVRSNTYKQFNSCFAAAAILSMSKRIMNEVMNVANDLKLPIIYQDTDSMAPLREDVSKMSNEYCKRYGKWLIGKELGQFHVDFEIKDCKDVYALASYYIAKKMYMCRLIGTHKETGCRVLDNHVRFKGVNKNALLEQARIRGGSYRRVYKDIIKGREVTFNLCAYSKAAFDFDKYGVKTKGTFTRTIKLDNLTKNVIKNRNDFKW